MSGAMECAELRGARVPKVGLGTWRLAGEECYDAVTTALDLGYRHVDTAQMYENERAVGRALADADADRDDVFATTKGAFRWVTQHRNVLTIPKSSRRDHLAENPDVFDFTLDRQEIDEVTQPSLLTTGASMVKGMLTER